jgi:hypothetical protein
MQVDGELQKSGSVGEQMQNRYYKGFVRGSLRIIREEGLAGLMRGAVPGTLRDASYSGLRIVSTYLFNTQQKYFPFSLINKLIFFFVIVSV